MKPPGRRCGARPPCLEIATIGVTSPASCLPVHYRTFNSGTGDDGTGASRTAAEIPSSTARPPHWLGGLRSPQLAEPPRRHRLRRCPGTCRSGTARDTPSATKAPSPDPYQRGISYRPNIGHHLWDGKPSVWNFGSMGSRPPSHLQGCEPLSGSYRDTGKPSGVGPMLPDLGQRAVLVVSTCVAGRSRQKAMRSAGLRPG